MCTWRSYPLRKVRALRSVILLTVAALLAGSVMFMSPVKTVQAADADVEFSYQHEGWDDGVNFLIKLKRFEEGAKATILVEFPHEVTSCNIHYPRIGYSRPSGPAYDDSYIKIDITYHKADFPEGDHIKGTAWGMNIGKDARDTKVKITSYSVPEPTPTTAPTATPSPTPMVMPTTPPPPTARPTTAAPAKTPTATPTAVPARTVTPTAAPTVAPTAAAAVTPTAGPTSAPTVTPTVADDQTSTTTTTEETKATTTKADDDKTSTTTEADETTESESGESSVTAPAVIVGMDDPLPSDPTDPSGGDPEGGDDSTGPDTVQLMTKTGRKDNKLSFWHLIAVFLFLFLIGRYIYLNKVKKYTPKESLIRLIPGVPALYCNISKNMLDSQIAAEAAMAARTSSSQPGYNTASAMKALRDMEQGDRPAFKPAPVTPINRPGSATAAAASDKKSNITATPERNNRMENESPKLTDVEKEAFEKAAKAKEEAEAAAKRAALAKAEAEKAAAEMEAARKAAEEAEALIPETPEAAVTTAIGGTAVSEDMGSPFKKIEEEPKSPFKPVKETVSEPEAKEEPVIPKKPVWEKEEKDTSYRASIVNFEHRKPDSDEVNALGSALSKSKTPPPASQRPRVRANWDNYGGASPFKPVGQDGAETAGAAVPGFVANAPSAASDSKGGAGKTFRKNIDSDEPTSFTSGSSRKAAFFNKAKHTSQPEQHEETESAYGGIRRPNSAGRKEEEDSAPALGKALEGKRPSILNSSIPMENNVHPVDGKDVQEG